MDIGPTKRIIKVDPEPYRLPNEAPKEPSPEKVPA